MSLKNLKMVLPSVLIIMAGIAVMAHPVEAVPNGGYAHPEILVQPEELKALIERRMPDLRVIDVRDKLAYLSGHVPGAVQVWRPDMEDKGHPLPGMMAAKAQIEELMGRLGVDQRKTIVIYSDLYDHARLWWILAYYGFPLTQMKLLDGGIEGWKAKGYPLERIPPAVEKTDFSIGEGRSKTAPLLCTLPDVKSALKNPVKVVLDVRSQKEYSGEEMKKGAHRAGRIPGVAWIEWSQAIVEEGPYKGYWKSAEEMRRIFASRGVTPEKDIYIY